MNLICIDQTLALKFRLTTIQAAFYTHFSNYSIGLIKQSFNGIDFVVINRKQVIKILPLFFKKEDTVYRTIIALDRKNLIQYVNYNSIDFIRFLYYDDFYLKKEDLVINEKYVYLMYDRNTGYYKIGISKDPKHREKTLQSEKPTIELFHKFKSNKETETILHSMFDKKRIRGEWFNLNSNDVEYIKSII